jgi:hypothetical protein
MKSFHEWREKAKFIDEAMKPIISKIKPVPVRKPTDTIGSMHMQSTYPKAWKASKSEVIDHWSKVPPGMPMNQLRTVPPNHKGPTYFFDGLRITGSPFWIDFVLSRLKDVLRYEDPDGKTRLQVIYKQIIDSHTQQPVPDSYVFYVQVKQREEHNAPGMGKPKYKQVPKPKTTI